MKIHQKLLLGLLLITFLGACETEVSTMPEELDFAGLSIVPPETPQPVSYDLDGDSMDDFQVDYSFYTWNGLSGSGDALFGSVKPLNGNMILFKEGVPALFVQANDSIRLTMEEDSLDWGGFPADVVSILTLKEAYYWPNEWIISSDQVQDFYFLAIKIKNEEDYSAGWIKLQINESDGKIRFAGWKITDSSFIVVGE